MSRVKRWFWRQRVAHELCVNRCWSWRDAWTYSDAMAVTYFDDHGFVGGPCTPSEAVEIERDHWDD